MQQYLDLLSDVRHTGTFKQDRTGTGTYSVFGRQLRFDLRDNQFPLVTTKKVHFKSMAHELLWMIKGDTNISYLNDNGVRIWNEWANDKGDLGPVYGQQWRNWNGDSDNAGIDQLQQVISNLKYNPFSRRHIVTAWNPAQLPDETISPQLNADSGMMALAPCHCFFQFYVVEVDGQMQLNTQLYQRSADVFLGAPFNIASYALLTRMVADVLGYETGDFIYTLGDAHLYSNHLQQADTQLERYPQPPPTLKLTHRDDIADFTYDDIHLIDYEYHPAISAPISI